MRTTLIFLASIAIILGIFAYFAVFGSPTGSYQVNPPGGTAGGSATASSSLLILATGTPAGTGTAVRESSSSDIIFGSSFATPQLTWIEGQTKISITAVSLINNQMTFTLAVQTGGAPECVPLTLNLVSDEAGDLQPPNPASFSFPESGNCNGAPNKAYANQTTTFLVDPNQLPLLFTTGGAANIFFEVATTTGNGLNVDFPSTSG